MSAQSTGLEAATIEQQCKLLHLPTVAGQCAQLAEEAVRERRTHLGFLEVLLQAELEDREQRLVERRIREAHLPRMKTLEEFDFAQCPKVSAQQTHELAEGGYIARAEPIIFIGDSGTGKTHLLTGLAVAACRQKLRAPELIWAPAVRGTCNTGRASVRRRIIMQGVRSCSVALITACALPPLALSIQLPEECEPWDP